MQINTHIRYATCDSFEDSCHSFLCIALGIANKGTIRKTLTYEQIQNGKSLIKWQNQKHKH